MRKPGLYMGEERGVRYGYEKTDTVPVVVIDEEKEKALKIGYMTLYAKLFMYIKKKEEKDGCYSQHNFYQRYPKNGAG